MKPLLPSLKEKKRYVVFEMMAESDIRFADINDAIKQSLLSYTGVLGAAQAGMQVIPEKWNAKLRRGIARVNHKYVDHLRASFVFISKIKNKRVLVRSVGVSGILKKTQKYFAG